jgi:hypothetical protein
MRCDNTSGYAGIDWHGASRKWRVRIQRDGQRRILGYFRTMQEAVHAKQAALQGIDEK